MGYEWLALAAAFLWAVASILSVTPAQHLGTFAYSRWRMGCTSVILASMAWLTGGWASVELSAVSAMALSGLVGIFIGDTALFACLNRMGPRQAGLLFSCHAVFSAVLGYFLFSESMTSLELIGSALVFSGVLTAIFFGRRGQAANSLESIKGNIWAGIGLGLLAGAVSGIGRHYRQADYADRDRSHRRLRHAYDDRLCRAQRLFSLRRTASESDATDEHTYFCDYRDQRFSRDGSRDDTDPLCAA